MKLFAAIFVIFTILIFSNCKKTSTTISNCEGIITDTIVTGDTGLYVPSAFTPNGDGLNEIFRPLIASIFVAGIDFKVYDENNAVAFSTQTLGEGWQPSVSINTYGKYYWRLQVTTIANHKIGACGDVYLVNCLPLNFDKSVLVFQDQYTLHGFTNPTSETLTHTCP